VEGSSKNYKHNTLKSGTVDEMQWLTGNTVRRYNSLTEKIQRRTYGCGRWFAVKAVLRSQLTPSDVARHPNRKILSGSQNGETPNESTPSLWLHSTIIIHLKKRSVWNNTDGIFRFTGCGGIDFTLLLSTTKILHYGKNSWMMVGTTRGYSAINLQ
jgi:hypothetical protein